MFKVVVLTFLLVGCSKTIIPQTATQFQVVSYAQLTAVTGDVYTACQEKVLTKETCVSLFDKINTAKLIIDSGVGVEKAADLLTYIRSKL